MSLLETMLGRGGDDEGVCKFNSERYDVTFTVSTESHDVAYAIPVSQAEVDALAKLVRVERETPYVEDGNDSLSAALESVLDEKSIDADAWVERMAEPRRRVEPIVETWRELVTDEDGSDESDGGEDETGEAVHSRDDVTDDGGRDDDLGVRVVYLPVGMESAVASFFELCRRRDERESDPFAFPGDVAPAATLLSRIGTVTERPENRIVVNTRRLPL